MAYGDIQEGIRNLSDLLITLEDQERDASTAHVEAARKLVSAQAKENEVRLAWSSIQDEVLRACRAIRALSPGYAFPHHSRCKKFREDQLVPERHAIVLHPETEPT
jgi:hypothetical protein